MSNVMKVLDEARYCLVLDNRDAIASQLLEAQLEIAKLLAAPRVVDLLSLVTKWEARAGEIGDYTQERTAASSAIRDCADQLQAVLEQK